MLRRVWQALNCFFIRATYCVIVAGASPRETKMWAAVRENGNFCTCGSNNWETVKDRRVHAARGLASIEFSFHTCNVLRDCRRGIDPQTKRADWPVSPTPTSARKRRFHVPQPTLLFPLETPLRLSRNMFHGLKDNSMLAKPLAENVPIYILHSIVSELYDA